MSTIIRTEQQDSSSTEALPPVIRARQLQLDGKRGRIYGPVDLDLEPGSLTLITGRAGSGKTSLLLTLVGRMKPNRGSDLTVLGRQLPARARGVRPAREREAGDPAPSGRCPDWASSARRGSAAGRSCRCRRGR